MVNLPEQLTRTRHLSWYLTFQVKFQLKVRGKGYRTEIKLVTIPKWSQTIAGLPEQRTQRGIWPDIWPSRSNLRSKYGVPDIVPDIRISGRYLVPRRLALNLTWKAKCQVKSHGCVGCSERLDIVWDYFGKLADAITGRYPVPHQVRINLTLKVKCQVKGHGHVSYSGRLAIVWTILVKVMT